MRVQPGGGCCRRGTVQVAETRSLSAQVWQKQGCRSAGETIRAEGAYPTKCGKNKLGKALCGKGSVGSVKPCHLTAEGTTASTLLPPNFTRQFCNTLAALPAAPWPVISSPRPSPRLGTFPHLGSSALAASAMPPHTNRLHCVSKAVCSAICSASASEAASSQSASKALPLITVRLHAAIVRPCIIMKGAKGEGPKVAWSVIRGTATDHRQAPCSHSLETLHHHEGCMAERRHGRGAEAWRRSRGILHK